MKRPIEQLRDLARDRVPRRDLQAWAELWRTTFAAAEADARYGEQAELWTLGCNVPTSTRRGPMRKPFPEVPLRVRTALVDQFMNFDSEEDDSDIL